MPKVIVEDGARRGLAHTFDRTVVIGRGTACDLSLDEPAVSRQHAMLRWGNSECYVTDLGSANGTFVAGVRIAKPTRLSHKDIIQVGTSRLRVFFWDEAPSTGPEDSTLTWVERHRSSSPTASVTVGDGGLTALLRLDPLVATDAMSRQLRFLDGLAKVSSRGFDQQALLSFIVDGLFLLLPHARRAFVLLTPGGPEDLALAAARSRQGPLTTVNASRALVDRAVANREGILAASTWPVESTVLCVPVFFDEQLFGAIQVDAEGAEERFEQPDVAVLTAVAGHIGMALAYTRFHAQEVEREILQRDLAVARTVQQHFLPQRMPDLPECRFAVAFVPAFHVGGDFYDILRLTEGVVGLAVGDVCGKGVAAALYGAKVSSDLRYLSAGETEPADILRRVNHALAASGQDGMFVTVVLAALYVSERRLCLSTAGQPLPLARTRDGTVRPIGQTGDAPIGIVPEATYAQFEHRFDPGDAVLFYSDGVTEALNAAEEPFGEDRLVEAFRGCTGTAEDIVAAVRAALSAFVGSAPQSDDTTLLCVRFTDNEDPESDVR